MKKVYFSNRIYKQSLTEKYVEAISHALLVFNQAKHFCFQLHVKEKRSGQSLRSESMHKTVKSKYNLKDYYANSVVQEANALMSSQQELKNLYISNRTEQIKSVKKKIKTTKSCLTTLNKIKNSFVQGKPKFNKTSREQQKGSFFVVQFKKKTDIYYHEYQFEHEYLDMEIAFLKSRLGRLNFRLDRLRKLLASLEKNTKSVVFGGKKLFKRQHTLEQYKINHSLWKRKFEQARYNQMLISGRKDSANGNFVFTYSTNSNNLSFQTPNGVRVNIEGLVFPYGQEKVHDAVVTQLSTKDKKKYGKAISWSIEEHGDYYIFKCIVDVPENESENFSKSAGMIGVDLNVDHIAWSNVNSIGQLIKSGTLNFSLEGKTSGQITKLIETEAIALVDIAVRCNKPISLEKLDTTKSKVSGAYANKKANRKMSMFAYKKLILAIKSRAEKMGVSVFDINPAYTSQIGKMKYMKRFGISIHEAASYVIARRAMGYKEKLPPVLHSLLPEKITSLHHWAQWGKVSTLLKSIRTKNYYQSELFDRRQFQETGLLFCCALTDDETKALSKLNK
ncbi:MAG: IS200/IS605 family accessory protein TnpB-related protein [Bacillota bacterium]